MARAPQSSARSNESAAASVRGRQPSTGDIDPPVNDGVGDDDATTTRGGAEPDQDRHEDNTDGDQQQEREPQRPQKPKADEARSKIFERFKKRQDEAAGAEDGEGDQSGRTPGDEPTRPRRQPDDADAGTAGAGDGADQVDQGADTGKEAKTGSDYELEVDGKKQRKSLEELSVLADLPIEDVKADPARAIRYAQRELASQSRLDKSKKILRETSNRSREGFEDTGHDPARARAPNQGANDGSTDGNQDQRNDARNTSDDIDYQKLVEDIQLEPPEKAAEKLKSAVTSASRNAAQSVVSESERNSAFQRDRGNSSAAMREFVQDHPEVKDKPYLHSAIAAGLIDEYRTDLRNALIAEGEPEDDVDTVIAKATPDQIARAHQLRRVNGDAHVRPINKAFIEAAHKRVIEQLGVGSQSRQQDFQERRQARKEDLRTQPRRSSVPPASREDQTKVDMPSLRKAAVRDIQRARGNKVR